MDEEVFTFVVLTHNAHQTGNVYCNRREADANYDKLVKDAEKDPAGLTVAYYAASCGGLVNAYTKP